MFRLSAPIVIFILSLSFVNAEITIVMPEQEIYNLGESVMPSVSIKESEDYQGFFSIRASCSDFKIDYYTIPLNLEANVRTEISVPEFKVFNTMKGACNLKANYEDITESLIATANSKPFVVSETLNIEVPKNITVDPGQTIEIKGKVMNARQENLDRGEISLIFVDEILESDVKFGEFSFNLIVSSEMEPSSYQIRLKTVDKYGNKGSENIELQVKQIPTSISHLIDKEYEPGSEMNAKVSLLDHRDEPILNYQISNELIREDETVSENSVESGEDFKFQIPSTMSPGNYILQSTYESITQSSSFEILSVSSIEVDMEKNSIVVTNTGNVEINEDTVAILDNGEEKYTIEKRIKMAPGENFEIDVSKKVPKGLYDIIYEGVEFNNVVIEDNRNFLKKGASGLSSVTGQVVTKVKSESKTIGTIILIMIIIIIGFYSRGYVKNMFKKKGSESTEGLFKDYKFE